VRLQRAVSASPALVPPPPLTQRSLIAGRAPLASPADAPGSGAAVPTTPAVQRLRYEDVAGPSDSPTFDRSLVSDDPPSVWGGVGAPGPALFTAPASAAWTPVPPPYAGSARTEGFSPPGPLGSGSAPGVPPARLQRAAVGAVGRVDAPTYPRLAEPSSPMVVPSPPGADPPAMVQRHVEAPSPSAPVASTVAAEPPPVAVSSRTVGLAEMFAMAAAQSSGGDASIQRSAVESSPTPDGSPAVAPPAASSAGPAGPAASAAPMNSSELEEMARRLYEPLSARFRAELWQDRERSGLLTDLRP
jgi:hypothetical protein